MDYDDDDEDEFEDDDEDGSEPLTVHLGSSPFSWWALASDAALMCSSIFHAAGKFAFDTAINLGQAHNLHIDRRSAEAFAADVMNKVREL